MSKKIYKDLGYEIYLLHNRKHYSYTNYKTNEKWIMLKSITKFFVYIVLLDLTRQHKINFSDSIKSYIPQYKYSTTIIQVLNHTSGLENVWGDFRNKTFKKYVKSNDVNKFVINDLPMIKTKENQFHYNNYAYQLLGIIIKKVTNMNYHQYLRKHFFSSNGINSRIYTDKKKNPFCSFGLSIQKSHLKELINGLKKYLKKINVKQVQHHFSPIMTIYGIPLYGHTGSGGQYLLFSCNLKILFYRFVEGDPDSIPHKSKWERNNIGNWIRRRIKD